MVGPAGAWYMVQWVGKVGKQQVEEHLFQSIGDL